MTELTRELHLLVSIAKLDAQLNACRTEIGLLPDKIEKVRRSIEKIDGAMNEAAAHLADMAKEKRSLEKSLDDQNEKIKKLKVQLMEVKTNKEYTAMRHEIEHIEERIDEKEERLLILMDELDQQEDRNDDFTRSNEKQKQELLEQESELEERLAKLKEEMAGLEAEKPKVLRELDPQIRKRYDRILKKLGDFAVTHVEDEVCQGCFSRVPPQTALEVKRNDQIIACQACGRILVHYNP